MEAAEFAINWFGVIAVMSVGLGVLGTIFWVWMLVDCATKEPDEGNSKLVWTLSSGPHHQDSGEAKIRESTAGVSRKPSSDGKARGSSSKHLCGLTAWNT